MREEPPTVRVDVLPTKFSQTNDVDPIFLPLSTTAPLDPSHLISFGLGPYLPAGKIGTFPNHHLLAFFCPKAAPVTVDNLVEAELLRSCNAGAPTLLNAFRRILSSSLQRRPNSPKVSSPLRLEMSDLPTACHRSDISSTPSALCS